VPLTLDDIYRIGDYLGMGPDDFFGEYCVDIARSSDTMPLPFLRKDGDACCFLDDNVCRVHFVKPAACTHMPSTMMGSLEHVRTQMPSGCAIHDSRPDSVQAEKSRKSYVTAMLLTTIYYSKFGTFKFEHAKPFIYRILLSKQNREQIYKLIGNEMVKN